MDIGSCFLFPTEDDRWLRDSTSSGACTTGAGTEGWNPPRCGPLGRMAEPGTFGINGVRFTGAIVEGAGGRIWVVLTTGGGTGEVGVETGAVTTSSSPRGSSVSTSTSKIFVPYL